ncbi:putative F-box/LRR-repeat protein At3g58880 isoform X3 [Silene latifolia]|uniref:putative F-box/LRR-repeat protein At3g58880 isoform X3 n=1 Tax=Silene latifolia TaxID=37657 RepID=UPI003D77C438
MLLFFRLSPVKAMKSSKKLGKHVKGPRGKSRIDRISGLPDELLGHILSFLPTRCAVSTSILSTRWRYLFTLTDCLSFDDAPCFANSGGNKKIEIIRKRRFKKFVYNVLELHQISLIKKFSLVCRGTYSKSHLNAWVSNIVKKGVQEIHYSVDVPKDGLPDDLLVCETLVRLNMTENGLHAIKTPLSPRLPSLKILCLDHVSFADYDSMQRLFSSCELLEELTLKLCDLYVSGHAIISTGVLKVLTIDDCAFHEELHFNSRYEVLFHGSLEHDHAIFEDAAYKTTELRLLPDSIKFLLTREDDEVMPDFPNLTRLHLCYFPYDSWKYVTSLLDKSPQLKTVIFEQGLHRYCRPVSPPIESLTPFLCHAKVIVVRNFCGHEVSLVLLGHLLRNASVLKKLTVHKRRSDKVEKLLQIRRDLLMLPKASSDCCIELK